MDITIFEVTMFLRTNWRYMSGIERSKEQINTTGEVFTGFDLVSEILDQVVESGFIILPVRDSSCGDGQFLSEVLIRKMEHGSTFEQALSTIYGVDLMPDNVKLCQDRLLCGQEHLRHIVERNIVCADGLRYHYRFDGTPPYLSDKDLERQRYGLGNIVSDDFDTSQKKSKSKPVLDTPAQKMKEFFA